MQKNCLRCGKKFDNISPTNVYTDIRSRKYCWTCSPYSKNNRKPLETRVSKVCAKCKIDLPIDEFYFKSSTGRRTKMHLCRTCHKAYAKQRELNNKIKLVRLKGGKCIRCGYNKNITALDFHHRDPDGKDFNMAHTSTATSKKVLSELEKCDLVCSNCHREIHNPEKNNLI